MFGLIRRLIAIVTLAAAAVADTINRATSNRVTAPPPTTAPATLVPATVNLSRCFFHISSSCLDHAAALCFSSVFSLRIDAIPFDQSVKAFTSATQPCIRVCVVSLRDERKTEAST